MPLTSRAVPRRILLALAAFGIAAAACSGSSPTFPQDAVAFRVNSDLSVGSERLLVAVLQLDGTRLGEPEARVAIEVAPDDDPSRIQHADARFTWTIPDFVGFYGATFEFDKPGAWQVTVIPDSGDALETILIEVRDNSCRLQGAAAPCAPRVGELAPSLATPTLADADLADLTTDPDPDERFYGISLDEALVNGRPSVIVFSTPAYCRTATCGPILTNVKGVAPTTSTSCISRSLPACVSPISAPIPPITPPRWICGPCRLSLGCSSPTGPGSSRRDSKERSVRRSCESTSEEADSVEPMGSDNDFTTPITLSTMPPT